MVEDNDSGVVGVITVDSLPTVTYEMTVKYGYICYLWKENHTSIIEDKMKVGVEDTETYSPTLSIFGMDTIL